MLMEWWQLTDERLFAECIMAIARNPQQGFGAWSDGETLIEFLSRREDRKNERPFIYETEFLELIEKALTDTIRRSSSDMLLTLIDAVDAANGLPGSITCALQTAVLEEFEDNTSRIREDDSESSLSDRIDALKKFAPRFGVSDAELSRAISTIEDRIGEIEERSIPASSPNIKSSSIRDREKFDDGALRDLFTPLLDR